MEEDSNENELEELVKGITWDKPFYYLNGVTFVPSIFDGSLDQVVIPTGFNTVRIKLDGKLKADLNWKQAKYQAQECIEKGYMLMWEIDLGLFSDLSFPLSHQGQYLSLGLSLEHFRDTLWKEFGAYSLGLIVYRGNADFSLDFPWNEVQIENLREWLKEVYVHEESFQKDIRLKLTFQQVDQFSLLQNEEGRHFLRLFCRNVIVEYLSLLTGCLPDALPRYLLLDATSIKDPLDQIQVLHPELFEQLNLAIKGTLLPFHSLGWESPFPYGMIGMDPLKLGKKQEAVVGVCLPSMLSYQTCQYKGLQKTICQLLEKQIPFRLIPESQLITNWDGLDFMIYVPGGLSLQGKRKLQGFCAAGGTAVTLGEMIGLPYEIYFTDLIDKY